MDKISFREVGESHPRDRHKSRVLSSHQSVVTRQQGQLRIYRDMHSTHSRPYIASGVIVSVATARTHAAFTVHYQSDHSGTSRDTTTADLMTAHPHLYISCLRCCVEGTLELLVLYWEFLRCLSLIEH